MSSICGMVCMVYVICYVGMCSVCVWCMWYGVCVVCDMWVCVVCVCMGGMIWYVCGVWCMDVYYTCDMVYAVCVLWSVLYIYVGMYSVCVYGIIYGMCRFLGDGLVLGVGANICVSWSAVTVVCVCDIYACVSCSMCV